MPVATCVEEAGRRRIPEGSRVQCDSRYVSDPTQVPSGPGVRGAILRETNLANERSLPICGYCRHSDGRGQGHAKGDPRPPFAFKMSMISEFCNSHYLLAACCVFHRRTSRVIHHRELYSFFNFKKASSHARPNPEGGSRATTRHQKHGNSLKSFR